MKNNSNLKRAQHLTPRRRDQLYADLVGIIIQNLLEDLMDLLPCKLKWMWKTYLCRSFFRTKPWVFPTCFCMFILGYHIYHIHGAVTQSSHCAGPPTAFFLFWSRSTACARTVWTRCWRFLAKIGTYTIQISADVCIHMYTCLFNIHILYIHSLICI